MRNVPYPVYVYARDCGEFEAMLSYDDLVGRLEPIDCDNAEYLVWDADGTPLSFSTDRKAREWLLITPTEAVPSLESFLRSSTFVKDTARECFDNTRFADLL
jgi:hypothetical protein